MWTGNLRKLTTQPASSVALPIQYQLPLADVTNPSATIPINEWVGQHITFTWTGEIHCVETGRKIKKTYGDGLSYPAWLKSPAAVPSVIHPELSRIHEGIALRDEAWEREHHLAPHVVYLSYTGALKVGVTRQTNVPYRWHDQGAVAAILVAEVPYRQLAGVIEVALKPIFGDKTQWRAMLKHQVPATEMMLEAKDEALDALDTTYEPFFSEDDAVHSVVYPVSSYPIKVSSVRLEKTGKIEGKLAGIKGQYLMFEGGQVINIRNHIGYRVNIELTK